MAVDVQNHGNQVLLHLRRTVRGRNYSLAEVSVDLGRPSDWLSKVLRGNRSLRLEDLFAILKAVDVAPAAFFAEVYDLYEVDQIGAEIVPGFFEGPVRRFVERVARNAAIETVKEKRRKREAGSDRPTTAGTGVTRSRGDSK